MSPKERSPNQVVLQVTEISKRYGSITALENLSFTVHAGEILGLLGPNGAGKTTAIRVLTTILPATSGHFTVLDIPHSRPEEIRGHIGVLPESNGFPAYMTGSEFLTYMGRLYGRSTTKANIKSLELLRLFGLERVGADRIATYSRGMRQRLAIARSLVNDPRILFLDEPTLGFDPKGQREMLQVIQEAAAQHQVAIILSSHLLEVVEAICHRVLILNHGRVVATDSVADIKRQVSVPHTCRLRIPETSMTSAMNALSELQGITAVPQTNPANEILVSRDGSAANGNMNDVLQHLLQAGVPLTAYSQDSARLSDAFLSMIEEVTP